MAFEHLLIEQINQHPSTRAQDIIKQCYQAAYGAEHLLTDMERARAYLEQEYTYVAASPIQPLYEIISPQVCRVNLSAWKQQELPLEWLFRMFAASAKITVDRKQATEQFLSYLDTADRLIQTGCLPVSFSHKDWSETLFSYKAASGISGSSVISGSSGISGSSCFPAVHHSEPYRQAEQPAYRIIRQEYVRLLPILEAVADHFHRIPASSSSVHDTADATRSAPCIIAIDGRAASGKTTLADQLSQILDADVIRMDDFFLPPELRTQERLQTPGGNVHYERFMEEVLPHLRSCEAFSYRLFDCHIMDYQGERPISTCHMGTSYLDTYPIRIVEGCYSHHPALGDYADIRIFSHVEADKQITRILHRNGPRMAQMFQERWIPMEENYIRACRIDETSHILIDSTTLF